MSVLLYARNTFCQLPADEKDNTKDSDADRARRLSGRQIVQQVEGRKTSGNMAWSAVFTEFIISDTQFFTALRQLHDQEKYALAIDGIQTAIRIGRASPWMYDILALEMKLDNRPAAEIGRVLESRVDFAAADPAQHLVTAAMLSRFEAWPEAISLLKDTAEQNPESAELWLLAKSIADKSNDSESIVWSRCGILQYVWTEGFERHHQEAIKAVDVLAKQMETAGKSPEAEAIRARLNDAASHDLVVLVRWVGKGDLDLFVTSPDGATCSYRNRLTSSGGRLVRDESATSSTDARAVHSEQFVQHLATPGEYPIRVRFVSGTIPSGTAVVEIIRNAGSPHEKRESHTIRLTKEDATLAVQITEARGQKAKETP